VIRLSILQPHAEGDGFPDLVVFGLLGTLPFFGAVDTTNTQSIHGKSSVAD
jgi:hypothetical protein